MGSKRNVSMSASTDTVKIVKSRAPKKAEAVTESMESQNTETTDQNSDTELSVELQEVATESGSDKKAKVSHGRSYKYNAARAKVDRTRVYDPFAAVEMAKRLSYSKFDGTISADGLVRDEGDVCDIVFPHSTGEARRVAIVDDALLASIEAGTIEFDILLSSPEYMPKLAKLAKILGPKGLMPNPKNGTLTPNPEGKKKEFAAGKMTIKTQRKMPVFHVKLGKVSMDTKMMVENLQALMTAAGTKLQKLTISATMGPGVKVDLSSIKK